ncbi:MAG: FtsX-like permease family protein [Candidatus Marinimicrobia bacterium]|nr:FtsX-like permease family protein [Candidatus Neomarinimicrobiota bacterium]
MKNIIKIAFRNLYRQKRRSFLTIGIVAFGVLAVLLFSATAGSFKNFMISEITDSMLGHIQIHAKGYVSSLDNLPLDRTLKAKQVKQMEKILDDIPEIESYSYRILLGGMLSNYLESTSAKFSAIIPAKETQTVPLLEARLMKGTFLKKGEILLPELITKGFDSKIGDDIVLVATNADGSVNGQNFTIAGIMESVMGPTGKYGYIHFDDAETLLRMNGLQVSEVAIRLNDFSDINKVYSILNEKLGEIKNPKGKNIFEVHTWEQLSPFYNIAQMIDMMAFFIQIILIGIVLVSIMNVMIMAVYERTKEIGSISAMGTPPSKIRWMFIFEGFFLGVFGSVIGLAVSLIAIFIVNISHLTVAFGRNSIILLQPEVSISQIGLTALIVIIVSIVAVMEPAFKASKLEPIEALRQN